LNNVVEYDNVYVDYDDSKRAILSYISIFDMGVVFLTNIN